MVIHWISFPKTSIILALLGLICRVLGDCAGSSVVTLPYENVTVLDASVRRGIPLGVGTDPQSLAFLLAGYANNTFLWDDSHGCDVRTEYDPSCIVGRGGIFFTNQSSTWSDSASSNITANDTRVQGFNFTGTPPRGSDILHLNDSYSLYDFPIATTKGGLTALNALGLGKNSTFLQTLVEKGAIISKTWSLFYGLTGAEEGSQMDGVAVFGGYDKAKTMGQNQTFDLNYNENCRTGMVVTITSIDVGFENGTEQNAFGSPMHICLDPAFEIISFTPKVVDTLNEKFGGNSVGTSSGRSPHGLLYNTEDAFTGNLSVTINDELKITVANDQLVVPDYVVLGNETVSSHTTREVQVGVPTGGDQPEWMTYLGQPFFTAAYLMVNQDQGTFSIWQNNPTHEEDYHTIDSSGSVCMRSTSDTESRPKTTNDDQDKALSTGAIVGIVIGVVAFTAIIATLLATLVYRRKVQKLQATGMRKERPPIRWAPQKPGEYRNSVPAEAPATMISRPVPPLVEAPSDSQRSVYELCAGPAAAELRG